MKGDEDPVIRSQSMQNLMDQNITRKGWNFFTAFIDIPDVFEDQLLVDESHANKFIEFDRRYQCFGKLLVKEGNVLKTGAALYKSDDGEVKRVKVHADKIIVSSIHEATVNVGGNAVAAHNVILTFRRNFTDGTKLTNLAGNKGVIRLMDLGYAIDPRTGEKRKIDIISACKSVKKRKNHSQILEAEAALLYDEKPTVFPDDVRIDDMTVLEDMLEAKGLRRDGTWDLLIPETTIGEVSKELKCTNLKGVCGPVFWGCIGTPHDALWSEDDTVRTNGRDLRSAGVKFSPMELRGLSTRFGKGNPLEDEIMSYVQGTEDLHEFLKILRSMKGEVPSDVPVVDAALVRSVDQTGGIIVDKSRLDGTIVDEQYFPAGFILKLPLAYQIVTDQAVIDEEVEILYEGYPHHDLVGTPGVFTTDKIYIPSGNLRRSWRHETGKFGLSEVGNLVNNIAVMCARYIAQPGVGTATTMLIRFVNSYFSRIASMMGSKRGEISQHGMSVRYPFSAKAEATLSCSLPKNVIEIHRDMARQLKVNNNDVVVVVRYPVMGFMSTRIQKVRVTDDPLCKFTIRASGNSLVSMGLDFDGDVIYAISFHTAAAKEALLREWTNPDETCYAVIKELNNKAGKPHVLQMTLQDYDITPFDPLTEDTHAAFVHAAFF